MSLLAGWWQWLPLLLTGAASLLLAGVAWRRGGHEGLRSFAALAVAVGLWGLAAAARVTLPSLPAKLSAEALAYLCMAVAPALWLMFVVDYLGWRMPPTMRALLVAPVFASAVLASSNARHGLVWSAAQLDPAGHLRFAYGPWTAQLLAPYGYALLAAGALLLLVAWLRSTSWTRWRFPALAAFALVPALASIAFLVQREPPTGFDSMPVAAALAVGLSALPLLRRRWFETLPLAQRRVFDELPDAQLVLDRFGRILDLNPAAERLLHVPRKDARGRTLAVLAPELRGQEAEDGSERPLERAGLRRLVRVRRHLLDRHGDELVTVEDATEPALARERLQRRGLLLEAVDALVSAPLDEGAPQASLERALARIGTALGVVEASVVALEGDERRLRTVLAWREPAAAPVRERGSGERLVPHVRNPRGTWVELPAEGGVEVVLPMEADGRAWGALLLRGGDAELLRGMRASLHSVASSLAGHVQRQRAEASRRRAERFQAALLEITQELLRHEVSPGLYRAALERALEVIPGSQAGSLLVRGENGRFRYVAAVGYDLAHLRQVEFDEEEMEAFFGGERAALIRDMHGLGHETLDESRLELLRRAGALDRIEATLAVPIVLEDRAVASLQLDDLEGSGAFGPESLRMAEAFGAQLGAVWRRLQLQARSERAAEGQRVLAEIERLLLAAERLESFFPLVARLLLDTPLLPLARVGVVRVSGEQLEPEFYAAEGRDLAFERRLAGAGATRQREEAWLREVLFADGPKEAPADDSLDGETRIGYPLHVEGRAWGVIVFGFLDRRAGPGSRLELLGQVVNSLELALSRQHDRERQERQLSRMRALVEVGEALRSVGERGEVVRRSLQAVHDATGVDRCAVLLFDPARDALRVAAAMRRGASVERGPEEVPAGDVAWRPLRDDVTVALPAEDAAEPGAFVGVPLRNREGEAVGVLVSEREGVRARFEADEIGFLEAVAQACSGALVRLGLLERSRRQASQYRELYAEARHGEQRFRLLAENMSDTVCLHDPAGRYLYLSPSVRHVLGYDPAALVGSHPRELFHPEDREALRERLLRPLRERQSIRQVTYRIRHADGHYLWFETNAQPVLGDDGEVLHVVSASRDVTERKRIEAKLVHGALYDELTGLPNRALLMDRLKHALDRARRGRRRFAVLFLDLDRFKLVNDSLGHGAGDELLQGIAARLTDAVRDADTVARLGGDEFCILLEDVRTEQQVLSTAERLQAALTAPFSLGETDVFTSASIGIAFSHDEYREPEELLRDADLAMYRAKAAGKARHAVFDHLMHEQAVHQLELETALHRAIERNELRVAYQPVIDLADGSVAGVEALVRWQHPERGLLLPEAFVPIAEESGLIVQVDRWVLREACAQMLRWNAEGLAPEPMVVSVNLSVMHFALPEPGSTLVRLIRETGMDATRLKLEITENVLMQRSDTVREALRVLRECGVAVQIDDFGTGYSSLSYLQELPIDSLKIDRRFVAGLEQNGKQLRLLTAIVQLAEGLGIDAVAEGIEVEAQRRVLGELGCRFGQGYLWAPALAPDEVRERFLVAP